MRRFAMEGGRFWERTYVLFIAVYRARIIFLKKKAFGYAEKGSSHRSLDG
jgi:hypothetical protein